ncbi:hypothetical protein WK25_26030 [Burkholderia latens]|nr:hypothetical protein WK25_26030 [Burkholderia latens]
MAQLLLSSVIRILIRLDVLAVVSVIRILRVVLVTGAVQILAAHDAPNFVIVLSTRCLCHLLVRIPQHLRYDSTFRQLHADPQLLRHDLRILLRSRVLIRTQLPIEAIGTRSSQRPHSTSD